jgi:hypothetical protein
MPTRAEMAQGIYGAWRLARLDRFAMHYFDLSHAAVWRSFWAGVICYPGFLALLFLRLDDATIARASLPNILLVETIGYIVAWTAFPLLALSFCRRIGREEKGFDFLIAYNWSQVLQTLMFVTVALLTVFVLPRKIAPSLDLAAYLVALGYEGFTAWVAIGAGSWIAAALVFMDLILGVSIALTASSFY